LKRVFVAAVAVSICTLTGFGLTRVADAAESSPSASAIPSTDPVTKVFEPAYDPTLAASIAAALPPGTSQSPTVNQAPFPNSQTFLLHSRAGATKLIYLDFTGHVTAAATSAWGTFSGALYDTDGAPAVLGQSEHDQIQSIWQRVSEDYAPFDVDVTTQEPPIDALERVSVGDFSYGMRVAIVSNTATTPICSACGGASIVNAFDDTIGQPSKQPVWVFEKALGSAKAIAEATSHEVGHTLGLAHDTNCGVVVFGGCPNLYQGHANWAPIMGLSYYRPVTQWARGEYPQHDHVDNETFILGSKLGWVPDGPNSSISSAVDMGVVSTTATAVGTIALENDLDMWPYDNDFFKFFAPTAGTYTVSVNPAPTSPNLDVVLYVSDAPNPPVTVNPISGMTSADVATEMDGTISINYAESGWHTIQVTPAQTDPLGATGYSTYGTLGTYTVSVTQTAEAGASFVPVTDARLLDTRPTPISAGAIADLTVTGVAGVPTNATAVVLNVTAVTPLGAGHLRVFPTGTALPNASVLNFAAGQNTPNQVIARVGRLTPTSPGRISLYAGGTTNVIVDISGYFVDDDANNQFIPVAPTALAPTEYVVPAAVPGNTAASTVNISVLGVGGIPSIGAVSPIAKVALNVSALNPGGNGHIRVFPAGSTIPPTSTNNFVAGDSRLNLVTVAPGVGGQISVYNASTGPVTVTVLPIGYFAQGGLGYVPIDPVRPLDTRSTNPGSGLVSLQTKIVQIRGFGPVPDSPDVKAVVVNIAAVTPSDVGTISLDYTSTGLPSPPKRTVLIHPANQNVANLAIATIGPQGTIRLQNNSVGRTHFIVDIVGYFTD
jgi:hypothetical protein